MSPARADGHEVVGLDDLSDGKLGIVAGLIGVRPEPVHTPSREGDVRKTEADVSLARRVIGYEPKIDIEEGLRRTVEWFRSAGG